MPLKFIKRYDRQTIMENPHALFVFGDNMARAGCGGQAYSARGCPNVVGIPTLWSPGHPFSDVDQDDPVVGCRIGAGFAEIMTFLDTGGTVYWPEDGIGTGIADLKHNAPGILSTIEDTLNMLKNRWGVE